jgi:hypothetical protein
VGSTSQMPCPVLADLREKVLAIREVQWGIMKQTRDSKEHIDRQDYMIASAEAYAIQKMLDLLNGGGS